jgi:hypothetical protein
MNNSNKREQKIEEEFDRFIKEQLLKEANNYLITKGSSPHILEDASLDTSDVDKK